jgi:hypothetical protein
MQTRRLAAAATVAAALLATSAAARAQAYMTPMPAAQPEPTDPPPHRLRGNPILGTSLQLGTFRAGTSTSTAAYNDWWIGYGLDDRFALIAYTDFCAASELEQHFGLGVGARGWPAASLPMLSLAGRAGIAGVSGEVSTSIDTTALVAGGSVILDLVRRPILGIELRGTLLTVNVEGQTGVLMMAGVGGSLY